MWLRRLIIFSSFTVLYSQSIHNAYGLGLISFDHNAAAAAMSSRGIVPTFNQNISITFKHASLNKIPADKFKFIIPEGTDIVNLKNNIE